MTGINWAGLFVLGFGLLSCSSDDKSPKKSGDGGGGSTGWIAAVGDEGSFLQTFDEKSWQTHTLAQADLYAVTCVTNADGWAVGALGTALRTRDGGKTWSTEDAHTSSTLRTVHFALDTGTLTSRFVGVTAGDGGALAVSLDGGDDWTTVTSGTSVTLRSASASVRADLFVVAGDQATLLSSTDLGTSWHTQTLAGAGNLTGVAIHPDGGLILVVDDEGHAFVSHDSAQSFTLEATLPMGLHSVSLARDGSRALAAGDLGKLALRDSSGSWTAADSGSAETLFAALIMDGGIGYYLAGANGALLASSDDGKSWRAEQVATQATLRGLEDLGVF